MATTTATTVRITVDQLETMRAELGDDFAFVMACQDGKLGPVVAAAAVDAVSGMGCEPAEMVDDEAVANAVVDAVAALEPEEGVGFAFANVLLAEAAVALDALNFPLGEVRSDLERRDSELQLNRGFDWVLLGLTEGY